MSRLKFVFYKKVLIFEFELRRRGAFRLFRQVYDVGEHACDVGVSALDSAEYCLDVLTEVEVVELAALDEREHECGVHGGQVAAALEPVLAPLGNAAEASLDSVVPDFHQSASQECGETLPVVEEIVGGATRDWEDYRCFMRRYISLSGSRSRTSPESRFSGKRREFL